MARGLTLVTAPALVVDLETAKAHLKVETDESDPLVEIYLGAAIDELDGPGGYLGRALGEQTWDFTTDAFPTDGGAIELPLPPLIGVDGVFYQATGGVESEFVASSYAVSGIGDRNGAGKVSLLAGSWPTVATGLANAVRVRFRAGYVDGTVSPPEPNLPAGIAAAVLLRVSDLFDHRGSSAIGNIVEQFPWTKGLLRRHRFYLGMA